MSSPLELKLDYTSASPIFAESLEFPEGLEGVSDTLRAVISSNASQAAMAGSAPRLQRSRVSQPHIEESIQKTQAFLEETLGLEFSWDILDQMEPIGNDSNAYQRLGESYVRNIAARIDAETAPKPFAKISIGDDGDMIAALSDSDPYIRLDESKPDAQLISTAIAPGNGFDYEDVPVGSPDRNVGSSKDSDSEDVLSYGTEDLLCSILISDPCKDAPKTAGLSVYQVAELLEAFDPKNGSEVEFIRDLFSKAEKQTVLFAAAMTDTWSLIPKIIPLGGLVVDEMDREGKNALHVAIAYHSVGAIAMLLDAGANLFIANRMGFTGYEIMKREKLFSAMQQFRQQSIQR